MSTRRQLVNTLSGLILPNMRSARSESHRVVKYSPRLRLAFSLLNEDASSGGGVFSWEVKDSIDGESAILKRGYL